MKKIHEFPGPHVLGQVIRSGSKHIVCGRQKDDLVSKDNVDDYSYIQIVLNDEPLHIALKGFKVFETPRVSKSSGSKAVYLASGSGGFLLQYMPKYSTTSKHYHKHTREHFHSLAGTAALRTIWNDIYPLCGDTVASDPYTVHYIETTDSDSLILLEMISEIESPGMADHYYAGPDSLLLDIHSKHPYPSNALSNFSSYEFIVDDVVCRSMEGFLQSLKESKKSIQESICAMTGKDARKAGDAYNEARTDNDFVYWKGRRIDRHSINFDTLIDKAYRSLGLNPDFQKALIASGDAILVHTIGKSDKSKTILTESELCSRLMKLRDKVRENI